jgi:hypothetical protein
LPSFLFVQKLRRKSTSVTNYTLFSI